MNKSFLKKVTLPALMLLFLAFMPMEVTTQKVKNDYSEVFSPCQMNNSSFQDGETLIYRVYYNWNFVWLSAGEVIFKVKATDDQYHLSAHGATYPSYEWFYKVDDRYDTYVEKETLLPLISIRDITEGEYRLYDKITFDQDNFRAFSLRGKSKSVAKMKSYDLNGCMHDLLSIIYYSRNLHFDKMSKDAIIPVKIFMDKEEWPLKVRYLGREDNVKVKGLGKFNTIKFSPEVILGDIFTEESKMVVWGSADKNKIPLIIESPISVGSVKVVLKEYNGLRYDLDAAVKLY